MTAYFFLSLMYAPPHQLGWDPTMRRLENGQYDIDVRSQDGTISRYRTLKLTSDKDADLLFGRGTRMWKVLALDEHGRTTGLPLTLKDSWIDEDRLREGAIYDLFRSKNQTPAFERFLADFFMNVTTHGEVYIEEEAAIDNSRYLIARGAIIPEDCKRFLFGRPQGQQRKVAVGHHFVQDSLRTADFPDLLVRHPKTHYRVVFKEVCKPLYELPTLRDIFEALGQACLGMCGTL